MQFSTIAPLYNIWLGQKEGQHLGRQRQGSDRCIGRFVNLFIKKQGMNRNYL